eukprot:1195471-Prorocentrum_minimum.AAC.3
MQWCDIACTTVIVMIHHITVRPKRARKRVHPPRSGWQPVPVGVPVITHIAPKGYPLLSHNNNNNKSGAPIRSVSRVAAPPASGQWSRTGLSPGLETRGGLTFFPDVRGLKQWISCIKWTRTDSAEQ